MTDGTAPAPAMPVALRPFIERLTRREDLTAGEAGEALRAMMDGNATEAQAATFLMALRTKGETAEEVYGFAAAMRERALRVDTGSKRVIDVCGTGGAPVKTFNISTCVGLVVAAAGGRVAKHGNRSATGACGSADVLEALGARIEIPPALAAEAIDRCGFAFLMAPAYHPATKFVAGVRRQLGVRTVFNVLGPLTNPAFVAAQSTGVFAPEVVRLYPEVLPRLGVTRAYVFHGEEGIDEVSPVGPTFVAEVDGRTGREATFHPADVGCPAGDLASIGARPPAESAKLLRSVLGGKGPAAPAAAVALNSAFAFVVAGLAPSLAEGFSRAAGVVGDGSAANVLTDYVALTTKAGGR